MEGKVLVLKFFGKCFHNNVLPAHPMQPHGIIMALFTQTIVLNFPGTFLIGYLKTINLFT